MGRLEIEQLQGQGALQDRLVDRMDLRNVQRLSVTLIVGLPGCSITNFAVKAASVNLAVFENA